MQVGVWACRADVGGKVAAWRSLETALRGATTETALRRARLQAAAAQARFERTLARSLLRSPNDPKSKVRAFLREDALCASTMQLGCRVMSAPRSFISTRSRVGGIDSLWSQHCMVQTAEGRYSCKRIAKTSSTCQYRVAAATTTHKPPCRTGCDDRDIDLQATLEKPVRTKSFRLAEGQGAGGAAGGAGAAAQHESFPLEPLKATLQQLKCKPSPWQQDKERAGRPEELVRLHDSLAALVADLSDVAAALGGVNGETLLDATAAQVRYTFHTLAQAPTIHKSCLGAAVLLRRQAAGWLAGWLAFERASLRCASDERFLFKPSACNAASFTLNAPDRKLQYGPAGCGVPGGALLLRGAHAAGGGPPPRGRSSLPARPGTCADGH